MSDNTIEMILLCKSMIKFHSTSKSIFAPINKLIWEAKLANWEKS